MVAGVTSQTALAGEVAPAHLPESVEAPYREQWDTVRDKYGLEIAGRHYVALGWRNAETGSVREPSRQEVVSATERLRAALNPPPVMSSISEPETVETSSTYSGGVSNSTVMCESGGDYSIDTGNGYYGGYQFDSGTWDAYGDPAYGEANEAPPAVQDQAAASVPYDAWPNC